jgi:hypothetical protein
MAIVVNLILCALAPTSVYIALPQGPTNHIRLDAPDQGANQGLDRVVGLGPVEIKLTSVTFHELVARVRSLKVYCIQGEIIDPTAICDIQCYKYFTVLSMRY